MKKSRTLQDEVNDGFLTKQQALELGRNYIKHAQEITINRPFLTMWINFLRKRKKLIPIEDHLTNLLKKEY